MAHDEGLGAASFFEYRDAIRHDFDQFYLTQTKRLKRSFAGFKSSFRDIVSFSGFSDLSDDEPVKMGAGQLAKLQLQSLTRNIVLRYKRHASLRALRDLYDLSDSTLNDIGLTRDDIEHVKRLPLEISPADELNKIIIQSHMRLV